MDIKSHRFVILGDTHFNTLGLARSLGYAGVRADIVVVGDDAGMVGETKFAKSVHMVETPEEGVEYIISNFADSANRAFLMTGGDKEISAIDARYDELSKYFITYNCGCQNGINRLLSKSAQNEIAQTVGLNVPDYEVVDVGEMPKTVEYPIITKAIDSTQPRWKELVFLCRDEEQLKEAYSKMECSRIMLQHYIEKENETGFNGISINGSNDVYIPLQLTYHYTLETTFGNSIYLFEPVDLELCSKVRALLKRTGYTGAFSVDLLIGKDKKVYFLEVNFRNSSWSYPYTCAGVNLPAIWAESMLKGRLMTDNVKIRKLPFSSIVDLWELSAAMKKSVTCVLKVLKQIVRSDSHILWDRRDQKPFWHLVKGWIKERIK